MPADTAQQDVLRAFRRNAAHVRQALAHLSESGEAGMRVRDGYLRAEQRLAALRRLATPVRRAATPSDRASLRRALVVLERVQPAPEPLDAARGAIAAVQQELDDTVVFGGRRASRGELFRAWMDAAVFYDGTDKQRPYDQLLAEYGAAIEALAAELTESYARAMLMLDAAAAAALGEPLLLPPPPRTPAPPPDPKERGKWLRAMREIFGIRD